MEIYSPITNTKNIIIEKELPVNEIVASYKCLFNIDVSEFFKNCQILNLCKCLDSGYRFFYPYVEGDSNFYWKLQEIPWYYAGWKWEHSIAESLISDGENILEIGCGQGDFIKKIKRKNIKTLGLEINEKITGQNMEENQNIMIKSIQEHATENKEAYTTVCMFQVLEHISSVGSFLNSAITTLKPGGKLIISVPNNFPNNLILENNILNMPPHHQGLWDINSLINLQNFYNIRYKSVITEPLQTYHYSSYKQHLKNKLKEDYGIFGFLLNLFSDKILLNIINNLSSRIIGHTVIICFEKKQTK